MGNITLKNVSKSFGATNIIPDIDLVIEDGEFVVGDEEGQHQDPGRLPSRVMR